MPKVFIVSGCRTAVGSFQGQFEKHSATELGTIAVKEAIARANIKPEDVDQCIMGQVLVTGEGQNPARQVGLNAGLSNSSTAYTINMLCGSGVKTVSLGYQAIINGDSNIVVAGGQENMSRAQHSTYLRGNRLGGLNLGDTILTDGLTDAFHNIHMGNTVEHCVKTYNISRAAQDEFAYQSQMKTQEALRNGVFKEEIVGVPDKKTNAIIDKDEFPKSNVTMEALSSQRTVFDPQGTVTAWNASGLNDGAAAVVLASEEEVNRRKLKPLAEIVAFAEAGLEPICMGIGPIKAVQKLLKKIGWTKEEVDLYELNEAYSAQSIIVLQELGLDPSVVNVAGGGIALGHPLGASGTRCLVTLIHNLKRLGKKRGVVSLCIGGGMGIAMAIQMC